MAPGGIFQRFFKKDNNPDTNYLSLTLTPDRILASVWTFDNQVVHVTGFAQKTYQNVEGLTHEAAVAIDSAAEKAKSDVVQVVFGLSASWFENGQLTQETSKLLKKLSEDLELDAQAFVPLSASIKNYLKIQESSSPSAVLLGVFGDYFEIHLVKNNQVAGTKISKVKPTVEKISSLLREVGNQQSLPSKILIYGLGEDSNLAQEIQKTDFKDIFVQEPKIEFITDSELAKSVALSQATDILGHEPALTEEAASAVSTLESVNKREHMPEADELGFIEGEDILKTDQAPKKSEEIEEKEPEVVEKIPNRETANGQNFAVAVEKESQVMGGDRDPDQPQSKDRQSFIDKMATLSWFTGILGLFKGKKSAKKITISAGAIVIFILITLFVAGQTITRAEVVIKVNAQSKEDTFDVTAVKGASANFSKQQIGGEEVRGEASGSRKAVATGKKKIGESAKGGINVFNWTTQKTNFTKGVVIIAKNGTKFALDSDVEVASRSASTPGQGNVNVTAVDLGPDGNVGAGSDFTFQKYDELLYSARNDNAFSGGDEKEVTVVSQDDLDKLEKSLTDSLKENATSDLKSKLSGKKYEPDVIVVSVSKKSFDKKLDDEASLVNLDLTVVASTVAYDESQLKEYLAQKIQSDAPENLQAKPEKIEILSTSAKQGTNRLNLSGRFQAQFVPKFEEQDLKTKIAGKNTKETREIIKQLPEVVDVVVNFSPAFTIAGSIPKNHDKITFKIES